MLLLAGAVVVVTIAVSSALSWTPADRSAALLPIAIGGGLAATALALSRFELFLLIVIALRASLDVAKLSNSSVDATGALSVLFIAAALVWLVRHRDVFDEPSPVDDLTVPFAAFFAAGVLSIAFSSDPLDSALEAVRIGTVVVIVITLARVIRDWAGVRALLLTIFASAAVPLGVAALQIARGGAGITAAGIGRIHGTFLHPNPFATYLFLLIVLATALFPHVAARWRWLLGPFIVGTGAVLISTYARGEWIATFIGLLVVAALQSRRLLWLIGVGILVVALMVPSVGIRLSDLSQSERPSGAPGNSLAWRVGYWQEALALQDDPVFGIGLGGVESQRQEGKEPHNDFIRVYVETGIVGLAAYLWLLIALFLHGVRTYRRASPGVARGLAVAFLATLSGLVVLSIAANVVSQLAILWYFAAIVVCASVASRLPSDTATVAA